MHRIDQNGEVLSCSILVFHRSEIFCEICKVHIQREGCWCCADLYMLDGPMNKAKPSFFIFILKIHWEQKVDSA